MIGLVFIDDGRPEFLHQTIESVTEHLTFPDRAVTILVNDSGDSDYAAELTARYGADMRQVHHYTRCGLAGAVRTAWTTALECGVDYILHWEGDFLANETIPINDMVTILEEHPLLAQVSLKRQPVNDVEEAAGGFIQTNPTQFYDRGQYVEHHTLFTFNPCLIPAGVATLCLNSPGDGLERGFTDTLLGYGRSFAILGTTDAPPRVHHIGTHRSQGWAP